MGTSDCIRLESMTWLLFLSADIWRQSYSFFLKSTTLKKLFCSFDLIRRVEGHFVRSVFLIMYYETSLGQDRRAKQASALLIVFVGVGWKCEHSTGGGTLYFNSGTLPGYFFGRALDTSRYEIPLKLRLHCTLVSL